MYDDEGHCHDCGSNEFSKSGNASEFEKKLKEYHAKKDELLAFYDHHGLLVDF
jgi:hypothetical protein